MVLLFTNELNKALQKIDQDIVNAMIMLDRAKKRLQMMRETEWNFLLDESLMTVLDVVTTDLLLGMASLNPVDSFANFDNDRIMKWAEYYPSKFGDNKLRELGFQLDSFIVYAQKSDSKFLNLKGIKDFARVMIVTKLDLTWPLIYLLVKLTLLIPVATASVERVFSSMKYIKNDLRNRMDDDILNNCLVCYIERKIFKTVSNDAIIDRFQSMKTRRGQL
ncbi:uncharacterized protein [Nicotiana tomentosiformis]|uniref:uncharacterized protein n=1 Tax=Nicotiana tomentosiformis TaxID=4098 RepID=UPI00388CE3AB